MRTLRDLFFLWCGVGLAAGVIGVASAPGLPTGWLLGAITTGLVVARFLRGLACEANAASEAATSLRRELRAAWHEADQLRSLSGAPPTTRRHLDDIGQSTEVPTP